MTSALTHQVAEQMLIGIFSGSASGGVGPIEARALYSLWKATGLRRDDLGAAVMSLTKSGGLRSKHQFSTCQYFLDRKLPEKHWSAQKEPGALPDTVKGIVAGAVRRKKSQAALVTFGRRSKDKCVAPTRTERRTMQQSRLLSCLPGPDRVELEQHLEIVPMPLGHVLWKKGDRVRYFYFPTDCVISLSLETREGALAEVATIGNEGMVDASALIGSGHASRTAAVELSGFACRVPANVLHEIFSRGGVVQQALLIYLRALMMQMAQVSACSRHHTIDQQICRLMLSCMDRTRSQKIVTTHERLSNILGVRREGVTEAIGRLRGMGLLSNFRGWIEVLDRRGMEEAACECHAAILHEHEALRPRPSPT